MPWKFVGFGNQHNEIEVRYISGDGDCVIPEGFYAAEFNGAIVLEAVSSQGTGQACGNKVVLARAFVELPAEVGASMPLVHAPVDPSWDSPKLLADD